MRLQIYFKHSYETIDGYLQFIANIRLFFRNMKFNPFNKFVGFLNSFRTKSESLLYQSSGYKLSTSGWKQTDFLKAHKINLYTNRAINKRGEKVGQIKFTHTRNGKEVKESKILDLLNQPNPIQTGPEFWRLYQEYKDVTGNVFVWLVPKLSLTQKKGVDFMVLLRPDQVEYQVDMDTGSVEFIKYNKTGGETIIIPKEEVLHSHHYGLIDNTKGESLMMAGAKAVFTEGQLFDYQANVLRNGGSVDGVFKIKIERLSKKQLQEIKDQYIQQLAEARKAASPLFLGGDADYSRLALTPSELSYLESKKITLEDISIMTGVPKTILGAFDNVKFDNADASYAIFMKETILPLMENLVTIINNHETISESSDVIGFIDPVPENTELKLKQNENGIKNYYMTINEARKNSGLDPVKEGDVIPTPFNLVSTPVKITTEKKIIIKKLKKDFEHPLRDKKFREKYGKMKVAKEDANIEVFEKAIKLYFKKQKNRIVELLESQEIKAKTKIDAQDVFNEELEIKIAYDSLLPLLEEFMKEAGEDTFDLVGADQFTFTVSSEIRSWLDNKVNVFSRTINETTFKRLQDEFSTSLNEGEDRRALIRRIQNTYEDGGVVISKNRATTIARTEVAGVMGKGTFEAYNQANVPIKIWVTVGDASVRDSHALQDGEEKPMGTAFSNGLQYPRDPAGSAEEVINCRCQI